MEKKKIGLLGAILMGIGCIVGSGIFGTPYPRWQMNMVPA